MHADIDSRKAKEKSSKTWTKLYTPLNIILITACSLAVTALLININKFSTINDILLPIGGLIFLLVGGLIFFAVMRNKGLKYLSEHKIIVANYVTKKTEFQDWLRKMQNKIS